ncbi:MAG: YceD family protein [Rhodobacteraceae bacterium]|nr:YceD family protein [Paracoccaceae bacterium]
MIKRFVKVQKIKIADLTLGTNYHFIFIPNQIARNNLRDDLKILSINSLQVKGIMRSITPEEWVFQGNFRARITQSCIITSEPLKNTINCKFSRRYVKDKKLLAPTTDNKIPENDELELLQPDINLFELARELLFLEIPEYPSKSGADFKFENDRDDYEPQPHFPIDNPFFKLKEIYPEPHQKTNTIPCKEG